MLILKSNVRSLKKNQEFSRVRKRKKEAVLRIRTTFHLDADPNPTFHSDPYPDPTVQFILDPDLTTHFSQIWTLQAPK